MDLSAYSKNTISAFKGLYKRGMPDNCPQDHAICTENTDFRKPGQVSQRDGMIVSLNAGHPVVRMFLSVTANGNSLLTADGMGNIYSSNSGTPIFTAADVVDFSCLNLAGRTYIMAIVPFGSTAPPMQLWDGVAASTRNAAGLPPSSSFTATTGGSGNVDVGVYQLAVSFVTDSGFVTPPSPLVSYTAPGGSAIDLTGIPTGPTGTVSRQILATQANELELFFIGTSDGGFINDNTTTTATLNFFSTDLAISADYLNDLYPLIPGAHFNAELLYYHNRLCSVRDSAVVLASRSQDPESVNMVDGLIQVPTEGGEFIDGLCQQLDVLYPTSFPGIWMVEDNTLEPAFWPITLIDGGVGSFASGIGTLSGTSNALSSAQTFLISDREGIYKFNGSVQQPALTWKIKDLWDTINFNEPQVISIYIDIFQDRFFVLAPIADGTLPGIMLMADYSEGLDFQNIKWAFWTFPFDVISATIVFFEGNLEPGAGGYFLRLAFQNNNQYIYAIKPGLTTDSGLMINSYYTTYLAPGPEQSSVSNFRAVQLRAVGSGPLALQLNAEDFNPANMITPPNLTLSNTGAKDLLRQINFVNEKMAVTFGVDLTNGAAGNTWTVQRMDLFARQQLRSRPQ